MKQYGLSKDHLESLIHFIAKYPQIEKAMIFGSRALGTFKESSDIDLVILGEKINFSLANHIKCEIEEESSLPFFVDIIAYESIDNESLRIHIQKEGKIIYEKQIHN